jgi:hypothetical protein
LSLAKGFDSNKGGVFDAKDAAFSQFGVSQDSNGDSKVEAGDYKTLADMGTASINLTSDGVTKNVGTRPGPFSG